MTDGLAIDLGGTRFRIASVRSGQLADTRSFLCAAFDGLKEAVVAGSRALGEPRPRRLAIAVAAPVLGDRVELTNNGWSFSIERLRQELGLDALHVVNDFAAIAMGLPALADDSLRRLGGGDPGHGPKVVIGPGTGLGVAALVPWGDAWIPVPGEGGHATLCATDERQDRILQRARRLTGGHVSAERLLSGSGLPLLHAAVCEVDGLPHEPLSSADICRLARDASDPGCEATVDTFLAMLGTVAGNLALTFGAFGGAYLAGGVAASLATRLERSPFRAAFEAKGRFAAYNSRIPAWLIVHEAPGLLGAAALLAAGSTPNEHEAPSAAVDVVTARTTGA